MVVSYCNAHRDLLKMCLSSGSCSQVFQKFLKCAMNFTSAVSGASENEITEHELQLLCRRRKCHNMDMKWLLMFVHASTRVMDNRVSATECDTYLSDIGVE